MSEVRRIIHPERALRADVREWQQLLIDLVLRVVFLAAIPALVFASYYVWQDNRGWLIPFYVVGLAIVSVIRFWRRAPYLLQVGTMLVIIYALAVLSLVRGGLVSNVRLFLVAFCFVATVFLGKRAAVITAGVSIATMVVAAWLFISGRVVIPVEIQVVTANASAWASYTLTLVMVIAFFVASQSYLIPRLAEALDKSRDQVRALETDRQAAEHSAAERLRHAERLGWAAALGNVLAALRQRDLIVWRVVREIEQTFGVYQVNLFLTDRTGETLNLVAAAGEQDAALVDAGYRIAVGSRSLPGRVAQIGREQTVLSLSGDLAYFPESHVEVCFPLSVRGEILGVLDIHSKDSTFTEEALQLFRIVTGYVTTSLDMVQLLEDSEARTQEMRALYAQYTQASWRTLLEAGQAQSYAVGASTGVQTAVLAAQAVETLEPYSAWLDDEQAYLLIVPLVARGVALGYLAFTRSAGKGDWSAESRAVIGAAAERLALALDNTRLLAEARRQAVYDEQLSRLGAAIWETPSSEVIMERTVRDLGRFLGASDVQVYVLPGDDSGRRGSGTQPLVMHQEQGA